MNLYYLIIFSLLFISIPLRANPSCGSSSCPLYHFHYNKAGGLHLRLSYEYINQNEVFVGSTKSSIGAIPEDHDEISTLNALTILQVEYGVSNRLGINLIVPYIHRDHQHILHDNGMNILENWNFNGIGDIILSCSYSVILPKMEKEVYLGIQAGVKLPTGITHAANSSGEQAEVTIQPGTGSWDAVIGLNFNYPLITFGTPFSETYATIPIIIGLSYQMPSKGSYAYKIGNTFLMNLGTDYQLSSSINFNLQINTRMQAYADPGNTGEPRENTGGTWIYLSPGVSFNLMESLSLFGYFQWPVYQNVHGIQQASNYNLQFGITADTNLF